MDELGINTGPGSFRSDGGICERIMRPSGVVQVVSVAGKVEEEVGPFKEEIHLGMSTPVKLRLTKEVPGNDILKYESFKIPRWPQLPLTWVFHIRKSTPHVTEGGRLATEPSASAPYSPLYW